MTKEGKEKLPRILMVTKSQQNRGSYMRLFPFASHLSRMGCDVTLIFPHEYRNLELETTTPAANFTLVSLPSYSDGTTPYSMLLRSFSLAWFLIKNLKQKAYDIIHVCSPAFPDTWLSSLLAKIAGVPLVVDIDDLWGFMKDKGRRFHEAAIQELLIRYGVRVADKVLVASELLRERYEGLSRRQIGLLWNGIEPDQLLLLKKKEKKRQLQDRFGISESTIVILATLDGPQLKAVTDALDVLEHEGLKIALLLPGYMPGQQSSDGECPFERRGSAYWLARMRREDFLNALVGSDLLLFLMEDTEWERARVVIKVPEFLASGTPLISASVGETKRMIHSAGYGEDNKLLVQVESGAIADAIRFYMHNQEKTNNIAEIARGYVMQKLTWEQLTKKLISTYNELIFTE